MSEAVEGRPVGVVVVTFDSAGVIGGLLDSLEDGLESCVWELVVVDNGSRDETVDTVRRLRPSATVIEIEHNPGYAAALNRGIRAAAPGSDIVVLNPDVRLKRSTVVRLRAGVGTIGSYGRADDGEQASARIGIVAPVQVDRSGRRLPSLRREPTIRRALAETVFGVRRAGRWGLGEAVLDPGAYQRPTIVDWASGAALLISRECLDACGPWDESFWLYSEDTEYALRARDRGFATALEPDAEVVHLGGESSTDRDLWTRLVLNKVALYRRRHPRVLAAGFRLASLLRELRLASTGNRPSRAAALALLTGRGAR